jgi:hypothetical protein
MTKLSYAVSRFISRGVMEWRDVVGYEGLYMVSDFGMVLNVVMLNILTDTPNTDGYPEVSLLKDGKVKKKRVHRLVAEAFIPNPENKPVVNHLDETRWNNRVNNLEWATVSENINHGTRNARLAKKLGIPIYSISDGGEISEYESIISAVREMNGCSPTIYRALRNPQSKAYGRKWRYK